MVLYVDLKNKCLKDEEDKDVTIVNITTDKFNKDYVQKGEDGVVVVVSDVIDVKALFDVDIDTPIMRTSSVHKNILSAICSIYKSIPNGWYTQGFEHVSDSRLVLTAFNEQELEHQVVIDLYTID